LKEDKAKHFPFTYQVNLWLGRRHRIYYLVVGILLTYSVMWSTYNYVLLPIIQENYDSRIKGLEEDVSKSRTDLETLRSQKDRDIENLRIDKDREVANLRSDKDKDIDVLRNDKDIDIRRLQAQITDWEITVRNLQDTLETLRSMGLYFGTYQIPYTPLRSWTEDDYYPLLGKRLRALADSSRHHYSLDLIIDTCPIDYYLTDTTTQPCKWIYAGYFAISLGNYSPLQIGKELYYFKCSKITDRYIQVDLYKSKWLIFSNCNPADGWGL